MSVSHILWRDDAVEFVDPDGYPEDALTLIPDGWDGPFMVPDFETRSFVPDLEAARAARRAEIDARQRQAFLVGYKPPTGPIAGLTLQLRNNEDRTNWLASAHSYGAAVAAGVGDVEGAVFRTGENETVTVSFRVGHQTLLDLQSWGAAIMGCAWRLKDAVNAAGDLDTIFAIDIEAEPWPA